MTPHAQMILVPILVIALLAIGLDIYRRIFHIRIVELQTMWIVEVKDPIYDIWWPELTTKDKQQAINYVNEWRYSL